MICAIVAMDEDRTIGINGSLPWHIPDEMAWFKEVTMHHKLLMGRKTYESLPHALSNRQIIVVTHQKIKLYPHDMRCENLAGLLKEYQTSQEDLIICGGACIFQQAMPYIQRFYISNIKGHYEGDTFLPVLDSAFKCVNIIEKVGFFVSVYER